MPSEIKVYVCRHDRLEAAVADLVADGYAVRYRARAAVDWIDCKSFDPDGTELIPKDDRWIVVGDR
ncbi:MAG: hypothetical protein JNM29_13655 [Candidatus Odyssella sp.]|nr:hypothetical protein [Candidatus Odyssella sp.]